MISEVSETKNGGPAIHDIAGLFANCQLPNYHLRIRKDVTPDRLLRQRAEFAFARFFVFFQVWGRGNEERRLLVNGTCQLITIR